MKQKHSTFIKNNLAMILFMISVIAVLVVSLVSTSRIAEELNLLEESTEWRLKSSARLAATAVTIDELDEFITEQDTIDKAAQYNVLKNKLKVFADDNGLLYVFYVRMLPGDDNVYYIVDNDFTEYTVSPDDTLIDDEALPRAFAGEATYSGLGNYTYESGLVTGYAPVFDEYHNVYCVAGVDILDEAIMSVHNDFTIVSIFQTVCVFITIFCGFFSVWLYKLKAKAAEDASQSKSRFLSRMSHELRTPLNAIDGFTRMAKESNDMGEIKKYLENIVKSSGHLLSLTNDILNFSGRETGEVRLGENLIRPADEFSRIMSRAKPLFEDKKQKFTGIFDEALPDYVYCDTDYIFQILFNLLSNASKFTPDGGNISFAVRAVEKREGECLFEWSVKDDGIGIAEEYLSKLFIPFEQADGGMSRKFGGTGLGLASVKQMVDLMDGEIHVKSELGSGSEFAVRLWVKTGEKPDGKEETAPVGSIAGKCLEGKRALLVEDSELNQMIAEDILTSWGAKVDIAENGRVGVEKYTENDYDIIFMDIQMPEMDGYECTRLIRASGKPAAKSVPIIAMTANVMREDIEKAYQSGMNAHVGKPIDIDLLEKTIVRELY